MDAQLLQQELRSYFQAEVRVAEPSSRWWMNAVARAAEQKRPATWQLTLRRSRLAWILIPLAILLLAGIAYASSSIIRERFASLFPQVERRGLAQEMDLRQTIDGVTVRIERAYADSNGALVGYTISGPPITATGVGQRYFSKPGALSIAGGPSLRSMGTLGTVPGSQDVLGDWRPTDRLAVLTMFDTSPIEGAPAELKVTLPIQVYDRVPIPEAGPATLRTFTFDFDVKFHAGTVVTVGQTMEAAGVPVTLEKMVIAPWATRATFSFPPPYDTPEFRPAPIVSLLPPQGSPVEGTGLFYGDFTSQSGEWTLTVSELVFFQGLPPGVDIGVPENENGQIRPRGPWVFHFNVP